ncbi:MAG: hypothetical protein JWP89_2598 [Schlesneria sp.]|nr:hypothetical protein [Schlesneria sp.]
MTTNRTSAAVKNMLAIASATTPVHQAVDPYLKAVLEKYQRMEEALQKIGRFKGNMHECRECHGSSAEDLAEEANDALDFDPLPPLPND